MTQKGKNHSILWLDVCPGNAELQLGSRADYGAGLVCSSPTVDPIHLAQVPPLGFGWIENPRDLVRLARRAVQKIPSEVMKARSSAPASLFVQFFNYTYDSFLFFFVLLFWRIAQRREDF